MSVKPIPDGYHTATPYMVVDDAAAAIEFYKAALGATELFRMPGPGGRIMHAEIKVGDSPIMLCDENPACAARSPRHFGGSPLTLMLYVEDVDSFIDRAVAAGAKLERPIADQFYGDRSGGIEDPFGHRWYIATHKEDVPPAEMQRRFEAIMQQQQQAEPAAA
jgi:PhnB protein